MFYAADSFHWIIDQEFSNDFDDLMSVVNFKCIEMESNGFKLYPSVN